MFDRDDKKYVNLINVFPSQVREFISKRDKYLGNQDYIKKITENYPINQDWNPVCEYYLGLKAKEKLFFSK